MRNVAAVLTNVSILCFWASYFVAFGLEVSRFLGRSKVSRAIMLLFTVAGICAHTIYLLARSRSADLPPLVSSSQDWMLVLAWLMILFYLALTVLDDTLALGVFILPVVLLLIGATYFMSDAPNTVLQSLSGWKMAHASLLMFGMSGVVIGFVLGAMYLAQHRRLKHKHGRQSGLSIPSLARLARYNRLAVMLSFPLLTAGMLIGVGLGLHSKQGAHPVRFLDPAIMTYGLLWLVMAALFAWLWKRTRPAGKQVAWMTIWGFGFLLLTLVGLRVLTGSGVFDIYSWHS